ncbi:MAG: hypothetical protein GXO79_15830 [Chlorobi bacterium]|nr:hypothetical protein [Chlorobiota bacterium]
MNLKIYILSLFFFKAYFVFSQDTENIKNDKFFEARYQNGFIYKHASAINRLVKGNISAIDINLGWQTKGNSTWQQLYRYPKAGIGLYYSMLNYPEILGNAIAGYGFMNIPLINIKNNYLLSYQTAFGATWVTKIYDENLPVLNDAYSTHLNIYFDFSVDISIRIYKQFSFVTAMGITHYSNGAVKMPNLGLNTITRQFGINYSPSYKNKKRIKKALEKPEQKNELWIFYSPAIKKLPSKGKTMFFASSLAINYAFSINNKRKLGVGLDLFYDESLKSVYINEGVNYKNSYRFRPGYHLSQDLLFGKFSFLLETGWYFTTHYKNDYTFYHRLGLKYRFSKNFFILYALKTHWATADYMELAIGTNINW